MWFEKSARNLLLDPSGSQHSSGRSPTPPQRIHYRQVGYEIGRPEWDDAQEILRYLRRTRRVTFFTRDIGFFRRLCHVNYCIVVLTGSATESATWIRRFLRHPEFRTHAQRSQSVVKLTPTGLTFWKLGIETRQKLDWKA